MEIDKQCSHIVDDKSGTPTINSALLAPFESGTQLLRLPAAEFEARCLKTAGLPIENARAFRSKFWQKHVDSQKSKTAKSKGSGSKESATGSGRNADASTDALLFYIGESSSKDPDPKSTTIPFKERIRPGMVVKWTAPPALNSKMPEGILLALIMCPVAALKTIPASVMHQPEAVASAEDAQFLCAMVSPGVMSGSYTVDLWRQAVLDVDWMDGEMVLEYDNATRYYYLAV